MRFLKSYGVALAIILIVGAWMATGVFVQGGKGPDEGERTIVPGLGTVKENAEDGIDPHLTIAERNAESSDKAGAARSVRIENYTVKPMPLEVTLRGRTEAKSIVPVVAQTSGIVENVLVTKGQQIKAGTLMCELDVSTRAAAVAQAKANLAKAQLDFDTNSQLRAKGFSSDNSGAQANVALESAKVGLEQAQAELERTKINSPIDGIVQGPMTDKGKMLAVGAPCASVVALDPIVFIGSIPEARIGFARTNLPVTIKTVTGQEADGKVTYISSTADNATRSFEVEVEVPNPDNAIRDGISAEATVNMGVLPAHLLPQSSLTLDDTGVLGVRAVEDSKVVFHAVTIVQDTREGVWVTGLPSQVAVITVGQENVQVGQLVNAEVAQEKAAL